jgi:hypothetical protein
VSTSRNPKLSRSITEMVTSRFKGLRVAMPAKIVTYYEGQCSADVQPLIQDAMNGVMVDYPVILGVPVIWPRSSTAYLGMPLAADDQVLLIFSDQSLDRWLTTGGIVDPEDPRRHHLSDAVAIPGCYEYAMGIADADSGMIRLGFQDGTLFANVKIDPLTGNIYLESAASAVIKVGSQTASRPTIPHTEAQAAINTLLTGSIAPLLTALGAFAGNGSWDGAKGAAVATAATNAGIAITAFLAQFQALANNKVLI